jgi:hypothetical protein
LGRSRRAVGGWVRRRDFKVLRARKPRCSCPPIPAGATDLGFTEQEPKRICDGPLEPAPNWQPRPHEQPSARRSSTATRPSSGPYLAAEPEQEAEPGPKPSRRVGVGSARAGRRSPARSPAEARERARPRPRKREYRLLNSIPAGVQKGLTTRILVFYRE